MKVIKIIIENYGSYSVMGTIAKHFDFNLPEDYKDYLYIIITREGWVDFVGVDSYTPNLVKTECDSIGLVNYVIVENEHSHISW